MIYFFKGSFFLVAYVYIEDHYFNSLIFTAE